MKRPIEIRSPPRDWVHVLGVAYPFLRDLGLGDLLVFGSQALSVYMSSPLRSKDLDLVSSQMGPRQHEALTQQLSKTPGIVVRSSTVQSRPLAKGVLKTYSVELRLDARPFFVEIFDKILDGRPPSILSEQLREERKWGLRFWAPSPDAVLALRLCFRRPEGVSALNAARLNKFIQKNQRRLHFSTVRRLIWQWGMEELVRENLADLYKRQRLRIIGSAKLLPALPEKSRSERGTLPKLKPSTRDKTDRLN